jgi:hypothetical protein
MDTFTGNTKWQLVVPEDCYNTANGGQKFLRYVDVYWKLVKVCDILFLCLHRDFLPESQRCSEETFFWIHY